MLSGFTGLVPPLVRSGTPIYVGISAGAHLATPDLLPCVSDDTRWKAPDLATTQAMGLVSFSVLAHYGKAPFLLHSVAHSRTKPWEDRPPSCFTCSRW
jgi:peptidase E